MDIFYDALLIANMDINHERKNKVKISNLKTTWKLGVILKEEFRAHVKSLPTHVVRSP